jgi:fatty-acyl-CoA synthase
LPDDPPELKAIAGRAMPGVSLRILDKNKSIVPLEEKGELFYRGPGLMVGYGNLSDGNSGVDSEGWFATGDLATMNEEGYINIVGRAKEMIIRGGENLYPAEIENYLLEHPGVLEVAVFGLNDTKYGEEVCACIRRDESLLQNEEGLQIWCKERISRWKIPKYIFFIDIFPVTPSGKIKKYKLQEKYTKDLNL